MDDIVRALDDEVERARSTLQQKLSGSSASTPTIQRERIMYDVLRGAEWTIRLQLVRQGDGLSPEQFRTLLETYLQKLAALKQEAWAMVGSDFVVLRFALDEQVRAAGQVAHFFVQEQKGVVPSWLAQALTLNVATLISEAEAAGALRDHLEGVHLKIVYDEQIARALGGVASTETRS